MNRRNFLTRLCGVAAALVVGRKVQASKGIPNAMRCWLEPRDLKNLLDAGNVDINPPTHLLECADIEVKQIGPNEWVTICTFHYSKK